MTKIIHLTENKLKKLIETAIEEDWRTYFNAAKESFKRERHEPVGKRGDKFEKFGLDQLMADPDFEEVGDDYNINRWSANLKLVNGGDDEMYTIDKHGYTKFNKDGYEEHRVGEEGANSGHPIIDKLANYYGGHSKYQKGKGWTESVVRKITESVLRQLRCFMI